jgi:hypothetical protein
MSKQKEQQPDISRRRILRGMASAPVVMTLANGAQGATVSALDCRIDVNPAAPIPTSGGECLDSTSDVISSGISLPGGGGTFLHEGAGSALRDIDSRIDEPNACVVYMDVNGNYVFASDNPTATQVPVTASCYTSFV